MGRAQKSIILFLSFYLPDWPDFLCAHSGNNPSSIPLKILAVFDRKKVILWALPIPELDNNRKKFFSSIFLIFGGNTDLIVVASASIGYRTIDGF